MSAKSKIGCTCLLVQREAWPFSYRPHPAALLSIKLVSYLTFSSQQNEVAKTMQLCLGVALHFVKLRSRYVMVRQK